MQWPRQWVEGPLGAKRLWRYSIAERAIWRRFIHLYSLRLSAWGLATWAYNPEINFYWSSGQGNNGVTSFDNWFYA